MPEHIPSHQNQEVQTDIKWIGNETLFKIGDRPVKLWEVIVGLILLSIFMPMLRGGRNGNRNGK